MSTTPPTRWRSGKTSFAGFGLAAVLLLILGVISCRTIRELTEANTLIARSHRVLEHLFELNPDLDKFKSFNDSLGHNAGDTLLRGFGNVLRMKIRGGDISCRYGGEEFALILPEASLEATLSVQHRGQSIGTVTVSIGVAAYPMHGTTSEEPLQAADRHFTAQRPAAAIRL